VVESTKAVPISPDREIVHVIPQDFILDRQSGVPNPVGMEAMLLETDVHIVTASQSHLNNVWKAIARAGFEVEEPIYGLLAVGDTVVTAGRKGVGVFVGGFGRPDDGARRVRRGQCAVHQRVGGGVRRDQSRFVARVAHVVFAGAESERAVTAPPAARWPRAIWKRTSNTRASTAARPGG
jgi:hypothetical protein